MADSPDKKSAVPTVTAAVAPAAAPVDPKAAADALAAFESALAGEGTSALGLSNAAAPTAASVATSNKGVPEIIVAKTSAAISGGTVALRQPLAQKPPVVSFRNVTKRYGDGPNAFTAIQNVSFDIQDYPNRGEFVSILGPSGCGKSTVIRMIAGLAPQFPQSEGEVLIDGLPVVGPGADRGMVFQDYTSFDHMSVLQNVAFGLQCRGVPSAEAYDKARHWIAKVGLSIKNDQDKYPHQLSGGMRQRVAIARTLILEPRIILMDEPFGALDPPTRARMQDNLVELWREQAPTIFFITHSIEEAVFLGDHVLIFSTSPGTVLKNIRIPPPDRPSMEMHRDPQFRDTVFGIRDIIETLESSQRAGD
ncbi:MAG: ABC transporter ATP-binding protein [Kofleriaceae bacterium]|nr:ABC transporter ATP-binding protein [Kofleriaceae bacterium]